MNIRLGLLIGVTSLVVLPHLLGCASNTSVEQSDAQTSRTPETLRDRGEAVFRLQNAVLDELIDIDRVDSGSPATDGAEILIAEQQIVSNCHALNEAASLGAAGLEPSLALKLRVLKSLAQCEASALAARAQLGLATSVRMSATSP